jgi:endogenous inhibitor of DNA gyrase (YacG/DUF329 family)
MSSKIAQEAGFMSRGGDVKLISDMRCKCPVCRKVIDGVVERESREGKFYPFCSQRCKLIDLGRWLDSKYRITAKLKTEEEEGENTGQRREND